jgi:asparagine N-glycosylation enzyme membrane subunit Stt3
MGGFDLGSIGPFILAAQSRSPDPAPVLNGHMFWWGLLIGLLIGLLAWEWLGWLGVLVALIMLGAFHLVTTNHVVANRHIHGVHVSIGNLFWLFIFVLGGLVGLYFGRRRGLRHLGESDFRTRWANVRNISPF